MAQYPPEYMTVVVPLNILILLLSLFFSGAYDKPVKPVNIMRGIAAGTLLILVIYSLLPETLRFSRFLLLMGASWAMVSSYLISLVFHMFNLTGFKFDVRKNKKIVIVGREEEALRVESLLLQSESRLNVEGFVNPLDADEGPYIGTVNQLEEIIKINHIDEIIFCASDISSQDIIRKMMSLTHGGLEYKIAPPESLSIIGSSSINAPGNLYLIDFESITKSSNRRNKKLFDTIASLCLLLVYPLLLIFVRHPGIVLLNIFRVLLGTYSWVGFHPAEDESHLKLPRLKPGILYPTDALESKEIATDTIENMNLAYAKNYSILTDARILFKGLRRIGRKGPDS